MNRRVRERDEDDIDAEAGELLQVPIRRVPVNFHRRRAPNSPRRQAPDSPLKAVINAVVRNNIEELRSFRDEMRENGSLMNAAILTAVGLLNVDILQWAYAFSSIVYRQNVIDGFTRDAIQQVSLTIEMHAVDSARDNRLRALMEILMDHWNPDIEKIDWFVRMVNGGISERSMKIILDPIMEKITAQPLARELQYRLVLQMASRFGKEAIQDDGDLEMNLDRYTTPLQLILQSQHFLLSPSDLGSIITDNFVMFEVTSVLMKAGAQVNEEQIRPHIAEFGYHNHQAFFDHIEAFRRFVIEYSVAGYPLPERFSADQDYRMTLWDEEIVEITQRRMAKFREFGKAYGAGTLGAIRSRVEAYIRENYIEPYNALTRVRVGAERKMIPTDLIREIIATANNKERIDFFTFLN